MASRKPRMRERIGCMGSFEKARAAGPSETIPEPHMPEMRTCISISAWRDGHAPGLPPRPRDLHCILASVCSDLESRQWSSTARATVYLRGELRVAFACAPRTGIYASDVTIRHGCLDSPESVAPICASEENNNIPTAICRNADPSQTPEHDNGCTQARHTPPHLCGLSHLVPHLWR